MTDLVDGALRAFNDAKEYPTHTLTNKKTGTERCCNMGNVIINSEALAHLDWSTERALDRLIQEALKFATHSKHPGKLYKDDVQCALAVECHNQIYGTLRDETRDTPTKLKDYGSWYFEEPPTLVCVERHWLAIEGVQPSIPQNPPMMEIARFSEGALPLIPEAKKCKLELSLQEKEEVCVPEDEVQKLYDVTTAAVLSPPGGRDERDIGSLELMLENFFKQKAARQLEGKVTDFLSDQVKKNLSNAPLLERLVVFMDKFVLAPSASANSHASKFIPALLSCIITKNIGGADGCSHFEIRSRAAKVLSNMCKKNGQKENKKIIKTLLHTLEDPQKSLPAYYGAMVALYSIDTKTTLLYLSVVNKMNMFAYT